MRSRTLYIEDLFYCPKVEEINGYKIIAKRGQKPIYFGVRQQPVSCRLNFAVIETEGIHKVRNFEQFGEWQEQEAINKFYEDLTEEP
jgi:hypothetical protein